MLDSARLREEADAHRERMASPLWSETASAGDDWMASASSEVPAASPSPAPRADEIRAERAAPALGDLEVARRLEALDRGVASLLVALTRLRTAPVAEDTTWLSEAAGAPRTYDAPDPTRTNVCARVHPALYRRLGQLQSRLGLRSTAGAWEFILRIGLAAADRLTAPGAVPLP
jgi:hypothetical protein